MISTALIRQFFLRLPHRISLRPSRMTRDKVCRMHMWHYVVQAGRHRYVPVITWVFGSRYIQHPRDRILEMMPIRQLVERILRVTAQFAAVVHGREMPMFRLSTAILMVQTMQRTKFMTCGRRGRLNPCAILAALV